MSGYVKDANTTEAVKSFESASMFLLQGKLYIRHYEVKPYPFEVYDAQTLQLDKQLTDKFRQQFDLTLKSLEVATAEKPTD